MKTSSKGYDLIKLSEGFRSKAYQDSVGVWTIGYGTASTSGVDVHKGMVITKDQATKFLEVEVAKIESIINKNLKYTINQNQFDALIDFCYNLGTGALLNSTLWKDVQAGKLNEAAKEFLKWDHAGGHVLAGLTKRRQAESKLFLS